jgi:hypothetical protein
MRAIAGAAIVWPVSTDHRNERAAEVLKHPIARRAVAIAAALPLAATMAPGTSVALQAQHEAKFLASFSAKQVTTWSIGPYTSIPDCFQTYTIDENGGETVSYQSSKPTRVLAYSFASGNNWASFDYNTWQPTPTAGAGGIDARVSITPQATDNSTVGPGTCGSKPALPFDTGTGGCQSTHGQVGATIAQNTAKTTIVQVSSPPLPSYLHCNQFYPEGVSRSTLTPIPAKMPSGAAIFSPNVKVLRIHANKTYTDAQSWQQYRIREHATVTWTITLRRV